MFRKRLQYEVVNECDYSEQYKEKSAPNNGVLIGAATAATASLATYAVTRYTNPAIPTPVVDATSIPPTLTPTIEPLTEPLNVLSQIPNTIPVMSPEVIQTGLIADTSLNMLATVLDPLVQILVAISFPIASVIMVGACFFFMLGNSEKAWQTIFNAGLGYVLIQMSPLFLKILQEIGKAI